MGMLFPLREVAPLLHLSMPVQKYKNETCRRLVGAFWHPPKQRAQSDSSFDEWHSKSERSQQR
jgi:hypothetical protein